MMSAVGRVLLFLLFVSCLERVAAQSTIYLVRHAEKAEAGGKDPDLSEAGRERAEFLARVLADANVRTIYVSPWKRTQQTAVPLADKLHLQPEVVTDPDPQTLAARLRSAEGNVLVVGHSNTLPPLLEALGVSSSIQIKESDYDDLFILPKGNDGAFLHLHY